jgi:hypothetical protein
MNWRQRVFLISVLLPFAGLALNPAQAQTRVGEAVLVQNQVARVAGSLTMPISVGDGLMRDETVRTGKESAARLVMADSTNLSIGPNASITLDRTVFNDEHSYREIAIKLATGAFRFVTGHSEKAAYTIRTPIASIGVRGTVIDILSQRDIVSQGGKTTVVLLEGAARVCAIGGACIELTNPGDTATVTSTGSGGKTTIKKSNSSTWTFAGNCSAVPGLCSVTQFAAATPPADSGPVETSALCGR